MQEHDSYRIDARTASDIRREIGKLAKSYTPEWQFNSEDPDIGSAIGMIFAGQMEGSILRFNRMIENDRIELVNMLGISPLPARPAHGTAIIETRDSSGDIRIARGTQLTGETGQGREILFETLYDVYITGAKLTDVVGISGRFGRIIPYYGRWEATDLFGNPAPADGQEGGEMPPIQMFSYQEKGIQRQALLFYHSYLDDGDIGVKFYGRGTCAGPAELFADKETFRFSYLGAEGLTEYDSVGLDGDTVSLHKERESVKIRLWGQEMTVLVLELRGRISGDIELGGVEFIAADSQSAPDFIHNGVTEMDTNEVLLFGDQPALYQECYIGRDTVFAKKEADITLRFFLEFGEKEVSVQPREEDGKLSVIKRKIDRKYEERFFECLVQEISIEYFNGAGWKKLSCGHGAGLLFADRQNAGWHEIRFQAPGDWEQISIGGYDARCLRLRTERADNCYMRPVRYIYPVIKDLTFLCSYGGRHIRPQELVRVVNEKRCVLTSRILAGGPFTAFSAFPHCGDSMYFGFDRKFENGPVSMYLELSGNPNIPGKDLRYEYSSKNGFKSLKVIDHTGGLANSGTVLIQPPADMDKQEVAGRERYWIRVVDVHGEYRKPGQLYPVLTRAVPNAVDFWNVHPSDMQEYTMDTIGPDMSFDLYSQGILSAQVWVNEAGELSPGQMGKLSAQMPGRTETVYNSLGEIEEFYVEWTETENFDNSISGDRHYVIDRLNSRLVFGDGVHVRIPRNIRGTAFKVKLRLCDGDAGNIPAGNIKGFSRKLLFVDEVTNPAPAFGGCPIEDTRGCLARGGNVLGSRRRLISENDYVREIMALSRLAAQVKCVCPQSPGPGRLSLAILMKDYKNGSFSFHNLKKELERYLPERCEMQYGAGDIEIMEPLFVEISVDVWVSCPDGDTFEIQKLMLERIEAYLEPVRDGDSPGWRIGSLPREKQLRMMLGALENRARIERYAVHAAYSDSLGRHETQLDRMKENPYAVCCNGKHHIYLTAGGEESYADQ